LYAIILGDFRGYDTMSNNQDGWKRFIYFLKNKKTQKAARVSYLVTWNLVLLLIIVGILGFSFAGGVGAGYFAALVKDEPVRSKEDLQKEIYNYEETSEVYFADEVYLGKLKSDLERIEIPIESMSDNLKKAVIATEDEYFYEHQGVVPKAILRAIYQEFTNAPIQSGGSTLTQQLIKNQVLTDEVSFDRKAKEILLALRVEKFFEKDEILEAYLNVSAFGRNSSGRNIAGVQSAAEGLFGKNAKDLTLSQAAFIAGLPQSPFGYTPYTQQGTLKEDLTPGVSRMKTVLKRMRDNHSITQAEYEKALTYDITKDFIGKKPLPSEKYPWLTVEIEKRSIEILTTILAKDDGYEESDLQKDEDLYQQYVTLADRNLRQNGYKIYTTIDKKIYDRMQEVTKNYPNFGYDKTEEVTDSETKEKKIVKEPVEAGAVLIENKSGKIISFVGGRDFNREQINHATAAVRSNGSTMKPLVVYAPGIELGKISPGSVAANVPVSINGWKPGNYGGGGYSGVATAREALAKSYNVPAALFYKSILNQKPVKYLEKMGFSSLAKADYENPSVSLGALEKGVTVEENVNAYATFANGGKFIDAYMIDKIVKKDGEVVYEHKPKKVDVFSPQTAYLTIDMMRDVISNGTATSVRNRLAFSSDWAGKTGTSQNFRDAWFVATNPNVTFGTWIGYDTPKSLQGLYNGLEYNKRNLYYWADLMNAAYQVKPKLVDPEKSFKMPSGIVSRSFCAVSGLLASEACQKAGFVRTDLFISKHVPTKIDNSFTDGQYVQAGAKRYAALPQTPSEFRSGGMMLSPDLLESAGFKYVIDRGSLLPTSGPSNGVAAATAKLNDNGKTPAPPSVNVQGNTLVWSQHPEGDVIGYRIYRNGKKAGSLQANVSMSFTMSGGGSYYVTAVDIVGKESGASAAVGVQSQGKKQQTKEMTSEETASKQESTDSTKNPDRKADSEINQETTEPAAPNQTKETPESTKPTDSQTKPVEPAE